MSIDLEKLPRWALVVICTIGIGASWMFGGRVIETSDADTAKLNTKVDTVIGVAYAAKNTAEDALNLSNDLKVQIADVRGAQETFRREYRDDQKDLDRKLVELLRAIKQ